jgi:Helix-turn-helix domain
MDKKIPPHLEVALSEINKNYKGNSAKQQCARLMAALRITNVSTFLAMRFLSIYFAPARAFELRKQGHLIDTVWQTVEDENGVLHRVGCYVLRGVSHE